MENEGRHRKWNRFFHLLIAAGLLALSMPAIAQRTITNEQIWMDDMFAHNRLPHFDFMADGVHYTRLIGQSILQYDIRTGSQDEVLFRAGDHEGIGTVTEYEFGPGEERILIQTEAESIYRRSVKAYYFVYDRKEESLQPVFPDEKHMYATLSPDNSKVGFVYANDLYYRDLGTDELVRVTTDGRKNHIINGASDWVYEEEFSLTRAFEWSPDGRYLAFLRFDESEVPEFHMALYQGDLYPGENRYKYPKVGENNARLSVHIHDLSTGRTKEVDIREVVDYYIPRIKWMGRKGHLSVHLLNRHQNHLELMSVDPEDGDKRLMLEERNRYYLEIDDHLTFLEERDAFLWVSEISGYRHIFLYKTNGRRIRQLTEGPYDVTDVYGIDEANEKIYFQAAMESPLERGIYSVDLKGSEPVPLQTERGWNEAEFSDNFDYYVLNHSRAGRAPVYTVFDRQGGAVRVIEDNAPIAELQEEFGVRPVEFFQFTQGDGVALNGYMIKPAGFDPGHRYPVLMYVYGGPDDQKVTDQWDIRYYWWFQLLAQHGILVACVDGRGTGGRGEEFRKQTYKQLGHYETIDQIEAAKFLGGLPYVDRDRIGIFGWSYGGFVSSLCILKGADVFNMAIAVAPVTNWRWYDSIYTERYMRTASENPEGYRQNSPIYFANRLRGRYFIAHGMADDNVHFQHTVEMIDALLQAGKTFESAVYPNNAHGIRGRGARFDLFSRITDFTLKSFDK